MNESKPLCLECGLCCNGVIFADVQLQPGDDAQRLQALGVPLTTQRNRNPKFAQPCAALDGCRCKIYAERPKYCREFDCLLLKNVRDGRLGETAARHVIRTARQRADAIRKLLRKLGDVEEELALSKRFQRMRKRMEASPPDEPTADLYSRLSLAVHDLNMLLSDAFYPGFLED